MMTETFSFESRTMAGGQKAAKKIAHLKKASMLQGESNSFDIGDYGGSPSSGSEREIAEKYQNISAIDDIGFSDSLIQMVSERKVNQNSITKKVER